jgi:hypothetical protein
VFLATGGGIAQADSPGPVDVLGEYLAWRAEQYRCTTPELHYVDHHRHAFAVVSRLGSLRFRLNAPQLGLSELTPSQSTACLLNPGSLSLRVTTPDGKQYETRLARQPARINVFRHGPHYIDARVFDLVPTQPGGNELPVRGELILHVWAERLYVEARLHAQQPVEIEGAALVSGLEGESVRKIVTGSGDQFSAAEVPVRMTLDGGSEWLGFVGEEGVVAFSYPAPQGTRVLSVEREGKQLRIAQHLEVPAGHRLLPGHPLGVACRLHTNNHGAVAAIAAEIQQEAAPLTADHFFVGEDAQFMGYNARAGYYTIATQRAESLSWLYQHPAVISTAPLKIHNPGPRREIAVQHINQSVVGGRLGAGILTDAHQAALPIIVQNSKNFCGENEEPFYDPGDPAYNETYFLLPLRQGEDLEVLSHHTYQNWGNHPIKQVGSLQAWMHYYQMSLGVTETTCHVPFRFGGQAGIWIADLRGISGRMWPIESQPQFDNVGGHRVFHYRTDAGESFPRYLRTRFRSTGPNFADWSMDYATQGNEARITFDLLEMPQTDVTRSFIRMRVDFDRKLSVPNARQALRLISLDTTQQRLRYDAFGYFDRRQHWIDVRPDEIDKRLVRGLTESAPLIAFSGCREDSHQHGNNAILVRSYRGTASHVPLKQLAAGIERKNQGEFVAWIAPDADEIRFEPGDFLELDLVVMPFGDVGDGPAEAIAERQRYGLDPPRVVAEVGQVMGQFPARVAVDQQGHARFQVSGGFGATAILLEGLDSYLPPTLEAKRRDEHWQEIVLGESGRGHQCYQTDEGRFGFVYLVECDGSPVEFRTRDGRR